MGRSLGELQRELEVMRERAEDREKRTELSLEELEALIAAKDEDTNRRFQEQAQENKETINKVYHTTLERSLRLVHATYQFTGNRSKWHQSF